jgi:hypothetical protein
MAGEKSSITSGSAVVFRAEMPKQSANSLYWRAIVLNTVKGDEWLRQTPPTEKTVSRDGKELSLNIFSTEGPLPPNLECSRDYSRIPRHTLR